MKPVLLLLPGALNDARIWADVAVPLDGVVQVRALAAFTQDSIAAMAEAAWQQVADVPTGVPLLVAGFSLGGYVALQMLAQPARALAGAALVSTSARAESPEGAANREKTIAGMQSDFAKVVDNILKWGTHAPPPHVLQRLRAMMLEVGAATGVRQNRAILARADHRAALAHMHIPVAVLCGREDRITPPALSDELAALLPSSRLRLVEGAGHMLPAEQPRAVAAALQELLERANATTIYNQGDK